MSTRCLLAASLIVALTACSEAPDELDAEFDLLASDFLVPPPAGPINATLQLTTPGLARAGDVVTITLTGAEPNQAMRLYGSYDGPGASTFCPAATNYNCLDILSPFQVAAARSDAQGNATFTGTIAVDAVPGTLYLQAIGRRVRRTRLFPTISAVSGIDIDEPAVDTAIPPCNDDLSWWPGSDLNGDGTTDLPYRLLVQVTAGSHDQVQAPITLDLDFGDILDTVSNNGEFDPGSLRVIRQDCDLGQPEVPSQFADGLIALDRKANHISPPADERGTVIFLVDDDGDLTTAETLPAGRSATFGIYFTTVPGAGPRNPPAYQTDLAVIPGSVWALENGTTTATFSEATGGLMSTLSYGNGPSLTSQTDSCCGNGMHFWATSTEPGFPWGWVTPQRGIGNIDLVEVGPLVTAIRSTGRLQANTPVTGTPYGSYDFDVLYWMFAYRPELHHTVTHTAVTDCTTEHDIEASFAFRPLQLRHSTELYTAATYEASQAGRWGSVTGANYGLAVGVPQPPQYFARLSNPVGALIGITPLYDYLSVHGNEVIPTGVLSPATVNAGMSYFENVGFVMMPYQGGWGANQPAFDALLEGVTVSTPALETAP